MSRLLSPASFVCLCLAAAILPAGPAHGGEPAIAGYADYETYRGQVEALAKSDLVKLESLGRTLGGREVYLLRIGAGKTDERPAVLVVGAVEPSHLAAGETALRLARLLVEGAAGDEKVRKLLDRVTVYVIPRPAPDACEALFRKPYYERDANERPSDDDRDGRTDEDGFEDLNGDGWITMMRVEDPSGPWMAHPDNPRVLIQADPKKNERGRWRLYPEGRDDDGDEEFNEDPPGGVAFNRNFPFQYPYFKPGAGPHQVSEVETRAVADFAFARTNIAAVLTFTPEDNLMRPWKPEGQPEGQPEKTSILAEDAPYVEFLAGEYQKVHGGKDPPQSPKPEGSFSAWAYFHYGRWSLAARGWWPPKVEKAEKGEPNPEEKAAKPQAEKPAEKSTDKAAETRGADDLNALRWFAREKIDGFVDWTPVAHPDFPGRKVEVGGFKPFLRLNPPAGELDGLAQKHLAFLERFAGLLPTLAIHEAKAEPLGAGVYRVTVTVLNQGYLPTFPKMGDLSRKTQPVQIALELPEGVAMVTGPRRVQAPTLSGAGGRHEQVFLVRGPRDKPATVPVRVWAPAVGEVRGKVELGPK